jgi:hypothetical protein
LLQRRDRTNFRDHTSDEATFGCFKQGQGAVQITVHLPQSSPCAGQTLGRLPQRSMLGQFLGSLQAVRCGRNVVLLAREVAEAEMQVRDSGQHRTLVQSEPQPTLANPPGLGKATACFPELPPSNAALTASV